MKRILFAAVVLCSGSLAAAAVKLPDGIALPRGDGSPGQVTFYHETHVDPAKPNCTSCHPKAFRILKATRRTAITHTRFEKGEACASCHNGRKAFAIDADCSNCHSS